MKEVFKRVNILIILTILFSFKITVFAASGTPLGSEAGQAVLGFEAYNCSSYITSNTDTSGMGRCMAQYRQGNLSTMKLTEDGLNTIDKDKYIMLITTLKSDTENLIRTLNFRVNYNNDALTLLKYGEFYGYTYTRDYPYTSQENWETGGYDYYNKYTVSYSNPTVEGIGKQISYLASTMNPDTSFGLNKVQNLSYHFFHVNEDATSGSTLAFTYGSQRDFSDAAKVNSTSAESVPLNQISLTLKVSGGATSNDNTFKTIQTSHNGDVYVLSDDTPFIPGTSTTKTFMTYVPSTVDDIDFNLIANDSGATITGIKEVEDGDDITLTDSNSASDRFVSEDNSIKIGLNTFKMTVTAADGTPEVYTFNVYRLSNDATIGSLTTDGINLTVSDDGLIYSGLTTYADTDTTVYATPNHQNASIASGAGSWTFESSGSIINTRKVVVQAENCKYTEKVANTSCTTKEYTINITRTNASDNANLKDLKVGLNDAEVKTINGFSKTGYTYNLGQVSYDTTSITVEGTVDDTGKAEILSGTGTTNLKVGANTINVVVLAENNSRKTYEIKVYRKSNNTYLASTAGISISSNPSGTLSPAYAKLYTGRYKYSYDTGVTSVSVTATVDDIGKAYVNIVDATEGLPTEYVSSNIINTKTESFDTPDTKIVAVIVTSENGDVTPYYIDLERQQSNNNSLSNLVVKYTQNGTEKNATLSPTFAASTRPYTVEIPADVSEVTVVPTKAVEYSTIRQIGDKTGDDLANAKISVPNFNAKQITIKVYSETNVDNEYYLTITRKKYDISTLDSLTIGTGSLDKTFASGTKNYTYTTTLPYSQSTLDISGVKTNSYASVAVSVVDEKNNTTTETITEGENNSFTGTLNIPTGTSTVEVLVTAHDNSTTKYTVTVNRLKNSDNSVKTLVVDKQVSTPSYDDTTKTFTVTVPFNTVTLTPAQFGIETTDPKATVEKESSITDLSTKDYKEFKFTVKAENGSPENYTVKVIKKANDKGILTRVTAKVDSKNYYCDVDQDTGKCTISVPVSTSDVYIYSAISENATVNPEDGTKVTMAATESDKNVIITVTSEDGQDVNIYTIKLERAKSSDNYLSDLTVDGVTVEDFSSTGNSFTDTEGGETESVTVVATVNDIGKASVSSVTVKGNPVSVSGRIEDGVYTFTAPLDYGTNAIVITVVAENEQPQRHNLTITRQKKETATISKVDYSSTEDEPTTLTDWNKNGSSYTLSTVSYDTTSITLIAYPEDNEFGEAKITSVKNENSEVTASNIANLNTTGNVYKAKVNLSTGTNTITLVGYAHNKDVTKTYTITVYRTKNSVNTLDDLKVKGYEVSKNDDDDNYTVSLPNNISSISTSDVTYTLPAGAVATYDFETKSLSTKTDNYIKLTITSEDGTPNIYNINVVRNKSNNKNMTRVNLKVTATDAAYNGKTYSCNFDTEEQVACTIDVPASTIGYEISSILADDEASVTPANGTSQTMSATESAKTIEFTVTAENNTTKKYSVLVNRAKSTNTNLASLTIDGTSVNNFKADGNVFYATVDGDTESVKIAATVEDTGKASITTDLSEEFDLNFGTNTIEITVQSEDPKVSKVVSLFVTREKRKDAKLTDIKIDGNSINEYDMTPAEFDPDTLEYTINYEFPYDKTSVNITATRSDSENASITSGIGNNSLSTGENTIRIHVFAHDNNYDKEYVLHLTRKQNSSTAIKSIVLANKTATYNETDGVYEVTVPNSVDAANHDNLVVSPEDGASENDPLATVTFTDTALLTTTTTDVRITVTAEDNTVNPNVILRVTREKSNVATLKSLTVENGSFNPSFVPNDESKNNYTVSVPEDATTVKIEAATTDEHANVLTGTGTFNLSDSTTTFQIHVQSEDGKKDVYYTLRVERVKSSDNTLKSVSVTSGSGASLVNYDIYDADTNTKVEENDFASVSHYKVTVPGNIDKINLNAVTTDSRATIDNKDTILGEKTLPVGNTTINIKVRSEKGEAQTYSIVITREKKSNNNLSQIKINGTELADFDPETTVYTIAQVANEVGTINVSATTEDTDAGIVSGTGNIDLTTGDNNINIVVRAQNGEEKTYTIKVNRKQSDDNRLSSLSVNSYQMTPAYSYKAEGEEIHDYYVTINYDKDTFSATDVFARAHNNTARISYSEPISINTGETKSFNVMVLSESGNTNTYTIHVTRSLSNNAYLKGVTVELENGTTATISPSFNKTITEYTVSIPFGVDKFTIKGTPEVSSTTVRYNNTEYSVESTNEVSLVTYAEIYDETGTDAEKEATMTYTFNIVQAQSNNAYLSNLYVTGYPFTGEHKKFSQAYMDYDIGEIDSSVTGLIINATAENANSKITYKVNTGSPSTSNIVTLPSGIGVGVITIDVLAPDGLTTIPYTISFTKVLSKNDFLASLTSSVGSLSPDFIKTTREYLLAIDDSVTSVDLTMYTESILANVKINDSQDAVSATEIRPYTYHVDNIPAGDTTITILVSAQDSSKARTYTVVIRKAQPTANGDASLASLEVDSYPFVSSGSYTHTTFNKDVTDYSIGNIPYSVDKLKVDYRTTQGESLTSVLVGGKTVIADAEGYIAIPKENTNNGIITVVVTAPNGKASRPYNIHYTKEASNNPHLNNIVVSNGSLDPEFTKNHTSYKVVLDEGVTNETITVTLDDTSSKLMVAGEERTSPYAYVLTGLTAGKTTATFVVTAEDGSVLTYYVEIEVPTDDEIITSNEYGHTIADGLIKTAHVDRTGLDMKNELDNDNAKLEIWTADESRQISDTDKIATGMIVKLVINGTEVDRKIIVVLGDINGDGDIDVLDSIKVINHYLEDITLEGAYLEAADCNHDGDVDVLDSIKVINHYLEDSLLH